MDPDAEATHAVAANSVRTPAQGRGRPAAETAKVVNAAMANNASNVRNKAVSVDKANGNQDRGLARAMVVVHNNSATTARHPLVVIVPNRTIVHANHARTVDRKHRRIRPANRTTPS